MAERTAIDVIVPLRDERHNIDRFLRLLDRQTVQPRRIVIADGMSGDGSREALAEAAARDPRLVVVDNPRRTVPAALNTALAHVTSPVAARIDMHADYDDNYLEAVLDVLEQHPEVAGTGGSMRTAGHGPWGRAIASTLSRSFGLGGARHRVGGEPGPIQHVFSGCYRTEVVRSQGGWDERLLANEDFEADVRLHEAGHTLWLTTDTASTWYVRETPRALARQMWRYGYYKGLTLWLHPDSLRPRQLAPVALVGVLAGTALVAPRRLPLVAGSYAAASATLGARAALEDGADPLRGAAAPALVHLSWGTGLIAGVVRFGLRRGTRQAGGDTRRPEETP